MVEQACSPWSSLPLFLGNKPRVRSIRFGAGHDTEGSQSHVHFDEKLHDSVVMVTQESDSSFLVKVCTHLLPAPPPIISLTLSTSSSALSGFLGLSVPFFLSCLHRHIFIPPWALAFPSVKWEVVRLQ